MDSEAEAEILKLAKSRCLRAIRDDPITEVTDAIFEAAKTRELEPFEKLALKLVAGKFITLAGFERSLEK